jgi:multidrug resistance efflux pump
VRAEVGLRDFARVCVGQRATIAADTAPGAAMDAPVSSISPAVTTRSKTAAPVSAAAGDADNVIAVVLTLDRSAPALPIGLPVTVRFAACPSKS